MKAIFTTVCTTGIMGCPTANITAGDWYGIQGLINSTRYFHPDIPHVIFTDDHIVKAREKYPWLDMNCLLPISMMEYIDDYDLVIHIDADSTVTGSLDSLIEGDYDACGVRNNHFGGGCVNQPHPIVIDNISWDKFLNVGCIGITNREFLEEYLDGCKKGAPLKNKGWDDENNEYNRIFYSGKYKTKILDDVGSNVSYGLTNAFGQETYWDSWKDMYINNNELYQINPVGDEVKVKILHMAGGHRLRTSILSNQTMRQWLANFVQPEVREYLQKVTGY